MIPDPEDVADSLDPLPPRRSSFRLDLTISVGYHRERAGHVVTGKYEATVVSVLLLLGGVALVLLVVWEVMQRL